MKLEKIVLNGFKSFADKTEFNFDSQITGIVGPNGCGKSNVVDAVKWVLGEQSVKSLRSGQMADVIFGGSSSRKPVGLAEVSLFFSNTSGKLPIETDQVQITRRIYKSGESEYCINNKVCRLKDVKELFMDTGIGTKAYSIIEQGQVEQLLMASPVERRAIFEEAAGISKYKSHKKEALRKLERTEQNLLRLADILAEVQKQLRSVKLQAGKARNYLEYTQRLKELQVNYSLVEYHKIVTTSNEKKQELNRIEEKFASVAAEMARNESLAGNLGNEIIETENQINQADNHLVSVQSKIEQQLQRIEFLKTRITELQQRKEQARERLEKAQGQKKQFEEELKIKKQEKVACEENLEEKRSTMEELQQEIQKINAECSAIEAELEDEKSGIIDIVRMTAQLHNEVQSISVYRNNLSNQKERLASRANTTRQELEKLLTEKAQQKARGVDIENVLVDLQKNLDLKRKEADEIEQEIEIENKRLATAKETRSALSSELSILADMETRQEGLNNAVKSLLAAKFRGEFGYIEGVLADIIRSDVKYASAVEAALEGRTDSLVVTNTDKLLENQEKIRELNGRINFICMDENEPFSDSVDFSGQSAVLGRLIEFVNYDAKHTQLMWKLVGKVILVDSIASAVSMSKRVSREYKFVTLNGESLEDGKIIAIGPIGKATGLISRKSRLRQLEKVIDDANVEITAIEEQIEKNKQTKLHIEKLCKDFRTAIYEANTEKMQYGSKLNVLEQNIERLKEEEPLIVNEIDLLEEQIAQSVQKEYQSKQRLQELEAVNKQRTERIEELEQNLAEQKELQQSKMGRLTELKVLLGQLTEQSKSILQAIKSFESQMEQIDIIQKTAQTELENSNEQAQQSQREILRCEGAISELFCEKDESQRKSRELHNKVEDLLEKQKQLEQIVRQNRTEENEIEQTINQLKIELSQLEVRQQGLTERVRDELQMDLAKAYEDYQASDSGVNWDAIKDEITELRGKIERLGNVNLDAINEQEELDKRNEFLSTQVEDLNKSKLQLQQLITKLNKSSRDKFSETFEQIRVHFQQLFRKLFGGGKADIILEEADDILDAGIEVIAKPPGKELRSISLLSGGEKTMTAIALLFSVFKAKPSPFCLLDEVDAALDEANNERFNLIVREFQTDSQFIVITHSKRTMSIADTLFGITMQPHGVSKRISVKFGEMEEQPAAVA